MIALIAMTLALTGLQDAPPQEGDPGTAAEIVEAESVSPPAPAGRVVNQATPEVAVALTDEEVRVTSGFTGARLIIYGVAPGYRPGDELVVALRGPVREVTVMRKDRIAGLWLNTRPATFEGAPSYYAAAGTAPLDQIAPPDALRRWGVGAEFVPLRTTGSPEAAPMIQDYRRAIIRLKTEEGLYTDTGGEVTLQEANLFRAEVRLPAQAPVGEYEAQAILFRDGEAVSVSSTVLRVQKAGLEAAVFRLSREQPFLYGLLAVAMALFAGWGAATIFNRR